MKKTSDYAWPPNFESLHLIETETGFICYLHHGHLHENIESKLFVIVEYPWLIASFPFKRHNHLWVFDNDFLSAYSKYKFLCFKMQKKKNQTKPGNQKLKENGF